MDETVWAIVELMGHVKYAGKVTEEEKFGTKLGRIDIPQEDGTFITRYFGGAAVYGMTPVTEEVARQVAKGIRPEPVQPWDYPKQIAERPAGITRGDAGRGQGGDYYEVHDDRDDDTPY